MTTHTHTHTHRLNVDRLFNLTNNMNVGGLNRFYIIRPDMLAVTQIAVHIKSDNNAGERRNYRIIFVPRKLASCDFILENEGVYGFVKILEWNMHLIPLDAHLLSLELNNTFSTLYVEEDYTMLHSIAKSLILLEDIYGSFPLVHGKGHFAQKVWDLFVRLKELRSAPTVYKVDGSLISEVVLFDRQCDLVTPLCSQLTYEGILDDTFRIRSGYVEISSEITGKEQDTKVLLNTKDPVFEEIRARHFSSVPSILSAISRDLKLTYHEGKSSASIPALKSFVSRLPELRKKHDSLTTHLQVSEQIVMRKKKGDFQKQLFFERAIIEAADKLPVTDYIEECIQRQVNFHIPLKLMCLMSTTNDGMKAKYFKPLKHQYLHSYGHKHIVTFRNLFKAGLLQVKSEDPTASVSHAKSTFKHLSRQLSLIPKDPASYDVQNPKDMSYVYGGAYMPLSCSAVEHVIKMRGWKGLDDVIKTWSGEAFSRGQPSSTRREISKPTQPKKAVLVYFIGGCTFSEINALRFLGEKTNTVYIIATTNVISPDSLIDSMTCSTL